jgi:hypothetical protein
MLNKFLNYLGFYKDLNIGINLNNTIRLKSSSYAASSQLRGALFILTIYALMPDMGAVFILIS